MSADQKIIELVLSELPHGVWVARAPDGEFIYANRTFTEIMGMGARDDVEAGRYSEPYGIYDRAGRLYPEHRLPFARAMREQVTVVVDDLVIHRRDGGRVNVRAFARPLKDPDGRVAMVAVIFSDITAEVRATESHALAQTQVTAIVNHAPIALFSLDLDGMITVSEGAGLKALGVRSGDLIGKSVFELYANHPEISGYLRRGLAGETLVYTVEVQDAVYESWLGPVRDSAGTLTGVIGVSTDITEGARARAKAVQADRLAAMGTVAASVAHELNNPIAHVLESLRLAEAELAGDLDAGCSPAVSKRLATLRTLLPAARESLEHMRVITRDLQTFSRPASEQRSSFQVKRALSSALQFVAKPLQERARLVVEVDESLRLYANEARLVQVLVNLLINATQAIPEGNPLQHEVRVRGLIRGTQASIEISDSGPGIPPKIFERLFEPFVTTKAVGDGTGLGLFVCRNLVEAMGGRIEAENRLEGGAVFRVVLPVEEGTAAEATHKHDGGRVSPARVLIIDDNVPLATVMAISLRQEGHQAEAIFSGQAAIDLLCSAREFDVVLCDLMMKDVSGMDVYEAVRTRMPGRERALVFMTGGAFTEPARQFLANAPNERLEKPFIVCDEVTRILKGRDPREPTINQ